MMLANFSRLKYWFLGLQSASADLFDWELKLAKQKGCNIVYVCTEQIKVKGNLGFLMNYIYARYQYCFILEDGTGKYLTWDNC